MIENALRRHRWENEVYHRAGHERNKAAVPNRKVAATVFGADRVLKRSVLVIKEGKQLRVRQPAVKLLENTLRRRFPLRFHVYFIRFHFDFCGHVPEIINPIKSGPKNSGEIAVGFACAVWPCSCGQRASADIT
jgi:hypothetical protein